MLTPISSKTQLTICTVLIVLASLILFQREQIGSVLTYFTGASDASSTNKKARGQRRTSGSRAIPVIVQHIATADSDNSITAIGTARARRHIILRPKSDGQLIAFLPGAGDRVAAGEMIFQQDTTQAKLVVQLAEKRLEDAQRLLNRQQQL